MGDAAVRNFLTLLLDAPAAAPKTTAAGRVWLEENPVLKNRTPRPSAPLIVRKKLLSAAFIVGTRICRMQFSAP